MTTTITTPPNVQQILSTKKHSADKSAASEKEYTWPQALLPLIHAGGGSAPNTPATCIIGESILAASLAAALQSADGRNARLIVPTAHAPQLLPPGTTTCPSETALIAMLADAAALLADPLYQALCPPDLPFLPLPHTACSGRLYEAQQRNLLDDATFSALLEELRYKAPLQNYGKESP